MRNVFIIGNGPSATRQELGKTIDAADTVVRLNDFQTSGFEAFVGTKTDILFTCRLNEYIETIGEFPEVILSLLMNPLDGVTIPDKVLHAPNITEHIDWFEVGKITVAMGLHADFYPSTGMICILKMIRRFGHVNITGFDNFKHGNKHYYQLGRRLIPTRHNGHRERELIQLFQQLGFLTIWPENPLI